MIIHIKNINAPHERLENFLNQLVKRDKWSLIKDTYSVITSVDSELQEIHDFEEELKLEGITIFVKKNGL